MFRGEILEDSVHRAVSQSPVLIRVAVGVSLCNGVVLQLRDSIVDKYDSRARPQAPVETAEELVPSPNGYVREPKASKSRVEHAE